MRLFRVVFKTSGIVYIVFEKNKIAARKAAVKENGLELTAADVQSVRVISKIGVVAYSQKTDEEYAAMRSSQKKGFT